MAKRNWSATKYFWEMQHLMIRNDVKKKENEKEKRVTSVYIHQCSFERLPGTGKCQPVVTFFG